MFRALANEIYADFLHFLFVFTVENTKKSFVVSFKEFTGSDSGVLENKILYPVLSQQYKPENDNNPLTLKIID